MLRLKSNLIFLILITFTVSVLFYAYKHNLLHLGAEELEVNFEKTGTLKKHDVKIKDKHEKVKACFVVLIRNKELNDWRKTMRQLEDRFNNKFNYPYVILNDKPFTEEFKTYTKALTKAEVQFGLIPKEHWSIPDFIDQKEAKRKWAGMEANNIIYGGSESYRHMCRFESGFFFRHNLTLQYDYYWRVEPGVSFHCDIDEDPFQFMKKNDKQYGFIISMYEYNATIETLWATVKSWLKDTKIAKNIPKDNAMNFLSNDYGNTYNLCHFWSNFEIASFKLWRDPQYLNYFDYLDKSGGFFYERWGDAPVHSIYAALTLPKDQIHFFNNIGYTHPPYTHCPTESHLASKCHCDKTENFDYDGYSCTSKWFDLVGHK